MLAESIKGSFAAGVAETPAWHIPTVLFYCIVVNKSGAGERYFVEKHFQTCWSIAEEKQAGLFDRCTYSLDITLSIN